MIVTVAALSAHLGFDTEDTERDNLLEQILAQVEAAFLAACGRTDRPFAAVDGTVDLVEVHDGTGTAWLFVGAPVKSLTSIVIGTDPESPVETIDPSVLLWSIGSTTIRRKDGGTFGAIDAIGVVQCTYTPAADAPTDVQYAVLRAAATVFLQRGAEDARIESEGGVRTELSNAFEDPSWRDAVMANRELRIG